ncbi:MAG TPA: outer membrane lipoprotein-sorting protein [Candidatus Acidoferrales bacterium]|nr:outer membrane lipoprotein-sorting protein [Candidatus Acidoferrales bacterium]
MRELRSAFALAAAAVVVFCGLSVASPANRAGTASLESIQRQMDEASKNFRSLSAEVERTKVTVVVNDRSTESGSIRVRGDKMLLELKAGEGEARTVLRNGDNLYLYNPGLKRVEEYNLGKHRALVEEFLLLGFGTSGKDLRKAYRVALVGEPVLESKKTVELELTPKSAAVKKQIAKVNLWLDASTMMPVQQEFHETGSGDYSIVRYSHVAENVAIPESVFKAHWPKGTQKIKEQE